MRSHHEHHSLRRRHRRADQAIADAHLRSPDTIITTAVTPIALMLLFVYVLGGAIDNGSVSYIDHMLPGILLITIASGIAYTAYRLFLDMQGGIFERF